MFECKQLVMLSVVLTGFVTVGSIRAQGLGGLINKAKEKAATTTPSVKPQTAAVPAAGGVGLDQTGHPQHIIPESISTPARERAQADAIMADPKPGVNEYGDGAMFHRLKDEHNTTFAYTADDSFFTQPRVEGRANYYISWIDAISSEFFSSWTATYGPALQQVLPKIKTIHFTVQPGHVDPNTPLEGWKFAFDKSTGTLTIYFSDSINTLSYNHPLALWMIKNVS